MTIPELKNLNSASIREKVMKIHFPEFVSYINEKYPSNLKWTEKLYLFYNNLNHVPFCIVCGKPVKFINVNQGYRRTCCYKCAQLDPQTIQRKIQTNMKKYGVPNAAQSEEVKEKAKNTCLTKYGTTNGGWTEEAQRKIKETNRKNRGTDFPMQDPSVVNKSKETHKKKYGVTWNSQRQEVKDKVKNTCIERYGGIGYASDELMNKCLKTAKENGNKSCISNISQKFFTELQQHLPEYELIFYKISGHEYAIDVEGKKYYLDCFIPELNLAIEFNGDIWHGNPNIYLPDDICDPFEGKITAKERQEYDNIRRDKLKNAGIDTLVVWESEYNDNYDFEGLIQKINELRPTSI